MLHLLTSSVMCCTRALYNFLHTLIIHRKATLVVGEGIAEGDGGYFGKTTQEADVYQDSEEPDYLKMLPPEVS